MAILSDQEERLVFRSGVAATAVSKFRNGAAGMHGKVQDSYAEGRVMACSIGKGHAKEPQSRFPVSSGTLQNPSRLAARRWHCLEPSRLHRIVNLQPQTFHYFSSYFALTERKIRTDGSRPVRGFPLRKFLLIRKRSSTLRSDHRALRRSVTITPA